MIYSEGILDPQPKIYLNILVTPALTPTYKIYFVLIFIDGKKSLVYLRLMCILYNKRCKIRLNYCS